MTPRLLLASASPARLATLRAAGVEPMVEVSGVDEDALLRTLSDDADVPETVGALAVAKATEVADRHGDDDLLVLGCDSLLEFDGEALGKPRDVDEARDRWRRMRGAAGLLHTGHHLVSTSSGHTVTRVATTRVDFAEVDDEEIEAYVRTGEPLLVAGAFTIDGLAGPFVRGVDGDHHNVVGVSLPVLREMLAELGVRWTSLW